MKLTFYGHARFLIGAGGKKNVNLDSITADYIFVAHGHGELPVVCETIGL